MLSYCELQFHIAVNTKLTWNFLIYNVTEYIYSHTIICSIILLFSFLHSPFPVEQLLWICVPTARLPLIYYNQLHERTTGKVTFPAVTLLAIRTMKLKNCNWLRQRLLVLFYPLMAIGVKSIVHQSDCLQFYAVLVFVLPHSLCSLCVPLCLWILASKALIVSSRWLISPFSSGFFLLFLYLFSLFIWFIYFCFCYGRQMARLSWLDN